MNQHNKINLADLYVKGFKKQIQLLYCKFKLVLLSDCFLKILIIYENFYFFSGDMKFFSHLTSDVSTEGKISMLTI